MLSLYRLIDEYWNPGLQRNYLHFLLMDALIWFFILIASVWHWPTNPITFFNLIYFSAKVLILRREFNQSQTLINTRLKLFLDDLTINLEKSVILIEFVTLLVVIVLIFFSQFRRFILSSHGIFEGDDSYQHLWILDYQIFLVYLLLAHILIF